jgi:hypothetical protein
MTNCLQPGEYFDSQGDDFILFLVFNTTNKLSKCGHINTVKKVYKYIVKIIYFYTFWLLIS